MKLLTPAILIFFLYSTSLCQAQVNNSSISAIERPKLVVGLVVDQMRWDYLIRYYERFGNGGFRRLMRDGYNFESASIPYGPTVTAAGHTCIYSGSVPALHGIVGNDWVENNTGEIMYCTRDRNVQPAGGTTVQGQMSPRNLLISTFPDELRIATNFRSRSFGIAMKDRGGILAAGHAANAAYWFEDYSGKWISSTWYMASLPAWVDKFNDQRQPDTYLRKGWDLLYPVATYLQSTRDSQAYEKKLPDEITTTFPHRYAAKPNDYNPFRVSPYGNTYTLDFAETLIREEKLGKSGFTDVLCISLSSTDYIAHRFGP
ncbi:MAG: alkaline phosphatase family protein, partial [Ferruginibacter sp.]